MLLSLAAIMLHQSFDWTCRKNKSSLVKNMALVVKEITGQLEVDINPSSPLYKAATKCYNLVKLKKNSRLGKEKFLKTEKETLEKYMVMFEVHMRPRVMEAIWNASIDKMSHALEAVRRALLIPI